MIVDEMNINDQRDHQLDLKSNSKNQIYKRKIVWFNAIGFLILHLGALYGFYVYLTSIKFLTMAWTIFLSISSALAVTMGAHRLYTHKTFKANWWIRFCLVFGQTVAGQNCLYIWVRDHRMHHKYSDTNADPHNAARGFFFSHIGWLMVKKHPDLIAKGKEIDMSDIEADALVMFQKKHYNLLFTILTIIAPMMIPTLWGETPWNGFFVCFLFRLILVLNLTWLVNSAAHLYGNKPFSQEIYPVENVYVSMFGLGEGWHNYHHTFPWDYRAAEFGQYFNLTTSVIDYCADQGWIWDKKCATSTMVKNRATKRGDGTHYKYGQEKPLEDMPDEQYEELFWIDERFKQSKKG
ncbi:acyl-CoA Delta-9 desaturase-like [Daktulosphaira vitifoliae]|uniref:acyl-CoA Delta-9 desaturase-like n=1 Tax=Daktulosphaira vitifoliae TaxID=58002 RepID=UPI0021AA35AF|nr:acyl-CoA Delta-9 desaturase-like [Daktulosphaira vitifoliae]